MAIVGVESVVFAVDDVGLCTRFWKDFGLVPVARTQAESVFEVASGSKVICRRRDDPRLPKLRPNWFDGPGIRETVWGVDTAEALETLDHRSLEGSAGAARSGRHGSFLRRRRHAARPQGIPQASGHLGPRPSELPGADRASQSASAVAHARAAEDHQSRGVLLRGLRRLLGFFPRSPGIPLYRSLARRRGIRAGRTARTSITASSG